MKNSRSIRVLAAAVVTLSAMLLAVPSTTVADVTLFDEGGWRVEGVEDLSAGPYGFGSIAVSTNGVPAGQFLELNIFFDFGTNGVPQVFSVMGTGLLRPALPQGEFGAAHRLVGYWDCDTGTFLNTGITELDIKIKSQKRNELQMAGRLSNVSSVEAKDLTLLFPPPTTNSVQVEIKFKLYATREFCVDKTRQDNDEGFQAARLVANYVSPEVHDSDVARYIGITDKTCYPYAGCKVTKKTYCTNIVNQASYLFNNPHRMGTDNMIMLHTDTQPANTPTVQINYRKPRANRVKVQGYVTPTDSPDIDNVVIWGNWVQAKKKYKNGRKIYRFQYTLEAEPPGPRSCN